ncbi:hypothetical protein CHS0354_014153, partial [Potamilus streckersoni]
MIFDENLTWKYHINQLVLRCKKNINLLLHLTGTNRGGESNPVKKLFNDAISPLIPCWSQIHLQLKIHTCQVEPQLHDLQAQSTNPGNSSNNQHTAGGPIPTPPKIYT